MKLKVFNPLHAKRHLYFFEVEEFHYYDGEPVTCKWAGAHELAIKTNDMVGLRIIQKKYIREIDGKPYQYLENGIKDIEKIVKGSNGKEYLVKVGQAGKHCTCPGFTFRGTCKHIAELA